MQKVEVVQPSSAKFRTRFQTAKSKVITGLTLGAIAANSALAQTASDPAMDLVTEMKSKADAGVAAVGGLILISVVLIVAYFIRRHADKSLK